MNIVEFQNDLENAIVSSITQRNLIQGNLSEIQGKLRSLPKDSLSPEDRNHFKKQEAELSFQLKSLDDKIQDFRNQLNVLEAAFKNRREISENSLVEREISAKLKNSIPRNFPPFIRGKDDIGYFLDKFSDVMLQSEVPKELWTNEILNCFQNDDYYLVKTYLQASQGDWSRFSEILVGKFGTKKSELALYDDLTYIRKGDSETIDDYCHRFTILVQKCKLDHPVVNKLLVSLFCKGLDLTTRSNLKRSALFESSHPQTPELDKVMELSRIFQIRTPPIVQPARNRVPENRKPIGKRDQNSGSKPKSVSALTLDSSTEDIIDDSPSETSNKITDSIYSSSNGPSKLIQEGFFIPITIDGLKTRALVDTGAEISVISNRLAVRKKFQSQKEKGSITFADGKSKSPRFMTKKQIRIRCGDAIITRRFDVMELAGNVDFLLGRDLLPHFNIALYNAPFLFPITCSKTNQQKCYERNFGSMRFDDPDPTIRQSLKPLILENSKLSQTKPCKVLPSGVVIALKGDSKPCFTRQYSIPQHKREGIDKVIKNWLNNEVIVRCKTGSQYNTPLLAVPKRNNEGVQVGTRVCLDFRRLNTIIEDDNYEIPLITDIFLEAAGNKFYSTIDLTDAYTQIPLAVESQPLTAFTWKGLQYMFKRCIYGIKTMTSVFQRLITNVLEPCIDFCRPYLDDIVVFSKTKEEHIKHVTQVLTCLNNALLKINISKSKFGMKKILLLGFVVNEEGIFPDNSKIHAITEISPPRNQEEVRSFLGKCNYLRGHIPGYAHIAAPLEKHRNVKGKFIWSKTEEQCFHDLKNAIKNARILKLPRLDLPFYLATDASNHGIGSMLYQIQEGQHRFVSFDSRVLSASERNYSTSKKELLALVYGLNQNFRFLSGRKFIVQTDHQALTFLFTQRNTNPMMNNWLETILSFNFSVVHIPGKENFIPDLLSRNPSTQEKGSKVLGNISVEEGTESPALISETQNEVEQSESSITQELESLHAKGHFQADQMMKQLRNAGRVIPNAKQRCKQIANSCDVCKRYNPASPTYTPLNSIDAHMPFDHLVIDLVTDLPKSEENYIHVLVVTDVFSKFTFLIPLADKRGTTVAQALARLIATHGVPKIIQSDQGTEFCNNIVERLCFYLEIDKRTSVAYSPRTNGLVERTNQTWVRILKKLADSHSTSWPNYLPATQMFLNNRIPESLPVSAFEAYYGRKNNSLNTYREAQLVNISEEEMLRKINYTKEFFWPEINRYSMSYHGKREENFNSRAPLAEPPFKKGDEVYIKTQNPGKLDELFEGPFVITNVREEGNFEVEDNTGRPYHRTVNTPQLKGTTPSISETREEG
jgi:transposase InsO family protein